MQIIPVIDVLRGNVVRAVAGDRSSYQPITSCLTHHVEPIAVIADLLEFHAFTTIYIADLDAIQQRGSNFVLYQQLATQFPNVNFWLDCGIKTKSDIEAFHSLRNISLVIATETLEDIELLQLLPERSDAVLSLDFKSGKMISKLEPQQFADCWPELVIAMSLDNVGVNRGPNIELLMQLQQQNIHSKLYAAGGVRNNNDLDVLQQMSVAGVLVASALHDGKITKKTLNNYKEICP